MPRYHHSQGVTVKDLKPLWAEFPVKLAWFLSHGYSPHYWQSLFHTMKNPDTGNLCRFRHLVAGRRGGKTLSTAWEILYYMLHPAEFHKDAHGVEDDRPLHAWVLTADYPLGMAALMAVRLVLRDVKLEPGIDFQENKSNRWFEFENGGFLQFKTADDPEKLRGAGLDYMWIDEAAMIPNENAWDVASPSLTDKLGLVATSTTPSGKNWFYEEFWGPDVFHDPNYGSVEYRSIDNPHYPREEWFREMRRMHPLMFKKEYMASFDSMAGKELSGEWLRYYNLEDLPEKLDYYIGVDPAISLNDKADRFCISAIGVTADRKQVYLVDQFAGRIPFPEQVDIIRDWHLRFEASLIGIERNAYQAALAQQVVRSDTFPPVLEVQSRGKKFERILAMSPLFRIGKVKIRKDHTDFINEWLDYDSELKNPKDDTLDSVEIALRVAGILLPGMPPPGPFPDYDMPATDAFELAQRDLPMPGDELEGVDEYLGAEW